MNVMLGCKHVENVSDVLYIRCYFLMFLMLENNVCNVLSFHVNNNHKSYTVLFHHLCHNHVYGKNLL